MVSGKGGGCDGGGGGDGMLQVGVRVRVRGKGVKRFHRLFFKTVLGGLGLGDGPRGNGLG